MLSGSQGMLGQVEGRAADPEYGIKGLVNRNLEDLSPDQFSPDQFARILALDSDGHLGRLRSWSM